MPNLICIELLFFDDGIPMIYFIPKRTKEKDVPNRMSSAIETGLKSGSVYLLLALLFSVHISFVIMGCCFVGGAAIYWLSE